MSAKELIKLVEKAGWELDRQNGSHMIFVKKGEGNVVVPYHGSKDISEGLLQKILKQIKEK